MAAITDLSEAVNRATGGGSGTPDPLFWHKVPRVAGAAATAPIAGRWCSLWTYDGLPSGGVAPTTVAVPDNTTVGGLRQANPGGGRQKWLMNAMAGCAVAGLVMLYDRILHIGGLSGTTTTAQTVGGTLTRYTDGVMAMLTIYATIGTTATTASVSYTDQGGTAGNASPLFDIGGTGRREGGRGILIPCASGDTAFQSIESVTLTGTTGTVGNFGVTLFRPLFAVLSNPTGSAGTSAPLPTYLRGISNLPEILDGACLFPLVVTPGVTSALFGRLDLAEC